MGSANTQRDGQRRGRASRKCRPLCNLSSTTSSGSSFSPCVPSHSAVLIDTEKGEKSDLSDCLLLLPVNWVHFFPSCPSSVTSVSCRLFFFPSCAFVSVCFLKLTLSACPPAQRHPIPHWAPVLFSPFLFTPCLVIYIPLLSPPPVSLALLSSSAVTSKVLYVRLVNYVMKISTKQYRLSLGNKIMWVHAKTGTCTNAKKKKIFSMLNNLHFVEYILYLWWMFTDH